MEEVGQGLGVSAWPRRAVPSACAEAVVFRSLTHLFNASACHGQPVKFSFSHLQQSSWSLARHTGVADSDAQGFFSEEAQPGGQEPLPAD